MKYKKKPVVIEAIQWNGGNLEEIKVFINDKSFNKLNNIVNIDEFGLRIKTLEGIMKASINDFIIKGIKNEFYPCKPDIFELTYDNIDSSGFQLINTKYDVAFRMKHKDIKGNVKEVMVRVSSATPILTVEFKKELVEVVKKIII